jgi:hypothetical protein
MNLKSAVLCVSSQGNELPLGLLWYCYSLYCSPIPKKTQLDDNISTVGLFSYRTERIEEALVSLLSTLFSLLVWFFGVTAFAGPVMTLVGIPIGRMDRLLAMLMVDPLGYQSTSRHRRFVDEEDKITKNTRWTKEVLKGMETSFL